MTRNFLDSIRSAIKSFGARKIGGVGKGPSDWVTYQNDEPHHQGVRVNATSAETYKFPSGRLKMAFGKHDEDGYEYCLVSLLGAEQDDVFVHFIFEYTRKGGWTINFGVTKSKMKDVKEWTDFDSLATQLITKLQALKPAALSP